MTWLGGIFMLGRGQQIGSPSRSHAQHAVEVRRPSLAGPFTCLRIASSGKGIVLLHDFQHATAEAAMDLLNDLKAGGYKVVFMKPKFLVTTIASYDEAVAKSSKLPSDGLSTSNVVRTISE